MGESDGRSILVRICIRLRRQRALEFRRQLSLPLKHMRNTTDSLSLFYNILSSSFDSWENLHTHTPAHTHTRDGTFNNSAESSSWTCIISECVIKERAASEDELFQYLMSLKWNVGLPSLSHSVSSFFDRLSSDRK